MNESFNSNLCAPSLFLSLLISIVRQYRTSAKFDEASIDEMDHGKRIVHVCCGDLIYLKLMGNEKNRY